MPKQVAPQRQPGWHCPAQDNGSNLRSALARPNDGMSRLHSHTTLCNRNWNQALTVCSVDLAPGSKWSGSGSWSTHSCSLIVSSTSRAEHVLQIQLIHPYRKCST